MQSLEPKQRRRKTNVSAMTATLPISGGGEFPSFVDAPAPRKTRKRKPKKAAAPPVEVITSVPDNSVSMTLPGVDLRALALEAAVEATPRPGPEAPDFVPDEPVGAMFAGAKVRVTAIGAGKVSIEHDQPLLSEEGDLVLRVPGLFAELSRMGARVISSDANCSRLELTRNAVFATFAVEALKNVPKPRAVPQPVEPPAVVSAPRQARVLAPTRALPAIFGDARVALLEVSHTTMRVAHSKPLPLDGEHPFTIKTDVADFSGSFARLVTWERLQDGRDVYLSTIEITRNAVSFTFGIDALISAKLLQERSGTPAAVEIELPPPPPPPSLQERELRPLVPVVRLREPRVALPKRHPRPSARAVAAAVLVFVVAVVAYVRRPDEHLRRARVMLDAYESGLMATERDYTLPVYANTLEELSKVRSISVSKDDADRLAERIRRAIAQHRQREAVKASMAP